MMMTELKTRKPAGPSSWYYCISDEGPCYGGYCDEQEARDAWWEGGGKDDFELAVIDAKEFNEDPPAKEQFKADYEFVAQMNKPAISTAVFDVDRVFEDLEDQNEFAVFDEVERPSSTAKAELENMLADALFRWMEKHDHWKHFRGLE